jgi:carbamoyl-phosphate synthase large subunit
MTILVSGASGVVGYGILKSLRASQNKYRLIGTTIYDFSIAPAFCDIAEKILPTDRYHYIENLCEIIKKHNVDMIIPSIECDMYGWNLARGSLNEVTYPLLNNEHLITICDNKFLFYIKLVAENPEYAIPTSTEADFDMFPLPFLLKPKHGYGS